MTPLRPESANTAVRYLYRDRRESISYRTEVFPGLLSQTRKGDLMDMLGTDEGFVAGDIGLAELQPKEPSSIDHALHEVVEIVNTPDEPTTDVTATTFYQRVMAITEWDVAAAVKRLGLDHPAAAPNEDYFATGAEKKESTARARPAKSSPFLDEDDDGLGDASN